MRLTPRALILLLAAVGLVADQLTKHLAVRGLTFGAPTAFLGPVASLTLTHNRGAAMGLVPFGAQALAVIGALVVVGVIIWGPRLVGREPVALWGLGLLLGGAVGNLLDRVCLGYVVDFIDFHFWPVFNVADIAVVCGAALVVLGLSRVRPEAPPPEEEV